MSARMTFAKMVHAQAHAVLALRDVRRALDAGLSRTQLYRYVDDEVARRCQACNLEPDLIGDLLDAARDEALIAAEESA